MIYMKYIILYHFSSFPESSDSSESDKILSAYSNKVFYDKNISIYPFLELKFMRFL